MHPFMACRGGDPAHEAVKKVFKTGSIYEDSFFNHDLQVVQKATTLIARFNQEMAGKDGANVNKPDWPKTKLYDNASPWPASPYGAYNNAPASMILGQESSVT